MNILLPPAGLLFWVCFCVTLAVLGAASWRAAWSQLLALPTRQHALFAAILGLAIFWLMQAHVQDTMAFHVMLMTVTTMVFGWGLAILIGAAALVVLKIFQISLYGTSVGLVTTLSQIHPSTIPVDFCLSVVVPVGWTCCVIWCVNHWKFKNPFTYFLGVGFFGAIASCVLTDISAYLLFAVTSDEIYFDVIKEHFFSFLLLAFPEGFINGTIATALTVFWPDLVKTYRDDWFLKEK
ncbi:membrane protein [Cellvibrio zantedeschiae]|uniref:Membrane protein n=1 Tax=Cellvibrio zantedeschiae TaxID=1237077 RepID=A0ABQ3B4P2_9GAMM|nr:hypothetical protein [Cellvibrio zantedeschiae]GGY75089.1 membrane protein [Cellvibrio zantedeschiae]